MRGSTNAIKPLHHYSTTEQVVGTWIGKPLYEKTIVLNTRFTGTGEYNIYGITDEEIICVKNGKALFGDAYGTYGYWLMTGGKGGQNYSFFISSSQNTLMLMQTTYTNDQFLENLQFTIQYTKTTDTVPSA